MTTTVTLDAADATELAELPETVNDWLHHSTDAANSYQRFTLGLHTASELRADLSRFTHLLGGNNQLDS